MVVQGIKKADKLSRMPLCEHASPTNSFQVLETYWSVQQERELQTESGVMTWITPIKPPHLDGSLGSFTMPATFTMPAGCLNASEKLTRWVAKYGTIADSMFSSKCSGWGLTFAPQWQSLLGNCRASHTLGNSHVGVEITSHHPFRNQGFLQPSLSWCQRRQGICVLS